MRGTTSRWVVPREAVKSHEFISAGEHVVEAMLAPPQARRFGPGWAATKKEAVNTHSNARFGGEVE